MSTPDDSGDNGGSRWESAYVRRRNGRLVYPLDEDGHRIPDFSWAGYRSRERPIPDVPPIATVGPVDGDNTDHLHRALRDVAEGLDDGRGSRGALVLEPGEYPIESMLELPHSGVVLRGSGDGSDPSENTIIQPFGERDVAVTVGTAPPDEVAWHSVVDDPVGETETEFVRVGDRSFRASRTDELAVGDDIVVHHPCTADWLEAIDGGGTGTDPDWAVGSQPIAYRREVRSIDGNELTMDAPVYNHLARDLAVSTIHRLDGGPDVTEVGLEDLRVDIQATGDRRHADAGFARAAIRFRGVRDAWARNCTVRNFRRSGFNTQHATRVTIRDCRAIDPFGPIEPPLRYNFNTEMGSQLILIEDCYANRGRHCYISNGTSTASGIVFKDVVADEPFSGCEGHRRFTHGLLFDNYASRGTVPELEQNHRLHLGNRGDWGTAHGWAAAHSVAWNATLHEGSTGLMIEQPPTAQNYGIGCTGPLGEGPFSAPRGHVEGHDEPGLAPASLYDAQLAQRLG